MDRIEIEGGLRLEGRVSITGAKNAALAMLPAALLTECPVVLRNVPALTDIDSMLALFTELGVPTEHDRAAGVVRVEASRIPSSHADYNVVRKMRASFLVLGPLLARTGAAEVSLPGGCAIGARGVDLHLEALSALGAEIGLEGGYVRARAPGGLRGGRIRFPMVSVGATENALMAAALARGESVIENAAREPEIAALAALLQAMGAEIEGAGTSLLRVAGREALGGAEQRVIPDRIEFGTYLAAAAITGGDLLIEGARRDQAGAAIAAFEEAGARVADEAEGLRVVLDSGGIRPLRLETGPYPGFPTDLQAQLLTLLTLADGASEICETVFEHRFMHVPELIRMGAEIEIDGNCAVIRGVSGLRGAPVMASDLRASVSLILAGLAAEGTTVVSRVYHLDRGYTKPVEKLAACGARIRRVHD